MALHPDSPYSPVPSVAPEVQQPNDYIRTEASPADFGGQVGGALQQAGATGEKLGGEGLDLAAQQQGLINQSLATNAETAYQVKLSAITDKYKTLEGLDAVAGHTQAVADITALRQQSMAAIPTGGAQRAFATLAQRHEAYAISDVGTYWAQQVKAGAVSSSHAMTSNAVAQAGTYPVAQDDNRFNFNLQSATLGLNDMMRVQGYGSAMTIDPKTAVASFDDSPQGKAAQAVYKSKHDEIVSAAWTNRIHALADDPTSGSVTNALATFNAHKDEIPPEAQMQLSAYLTPKLRAVNANAAAGAAVRGADAGYVASIGGDGSAKLADAIHGNEGGKATSVTSVDGAQGGWQIIPATFAKYAQPGESISNPTDNEAVGRRIVADLSRKFNGDPARVAVGYFSGEGNVAPPGSPTPYKVDAKDGNGTSTSVYVANALKRMGIAPGQYQVASTGSDIPPPPTGSTQVPPPPQTKADYYRAHESDIVESARQTAIIAHPDDPMAADLAANRAQQQVSAVIRQQEVAYKADSDMVYQAANGDLATGTAPLTVDQLRSTNPAVAQAWDRLQAQQPQVAHEVATRLLTENARTNGGDAKTYGPAFSSVFNRIHAPDGDPNRITDQTQLYSMVGQPGGLTMSGLEKARQEISGKNTPDGEAESKMREQFFRNAHGALTGTNDGLGLKDPKGEELYLRFMAAAFPAIESAKSVGKSPAQIYDPSSPDYVGKLIQGMKRSPAQYQQDLTGANGVGSAPATEAAKGYARADLEAEMVRRGLLKPPAAPVPADTGPQVPH